MKTIEEMRQAIDGLMKQLGDIKARCMNEGREYDDEEKKLVRQIQGRIEDLKEKIDLEEKSDALMKDVGKSQKEPPKIDPTDDDSVPYGTRAREGEGAQFRSLGEQLMAVITATTQGHIDPRLEGRATGLSEGVGSEGGFLLQDNFGNELISTVWDEPEVLGKLNKLSLTKGNNMKIPGYNETSRATGSRKGGIRMYWESEAGTKTASKPDFRMIELKLKKIIGLVYLTDELMEDVSALEGYVRDAFTEEMRFMLVDAIINGTGAGQPLGILNSGCLVSQGVEIGQATATLQVENIVKMWSRMIASSRLKAVWHINQDIEPQLYTMGITVGTGGSPIFMPPGGLSASPYATLMGRPIMPLEQCQTLGTKGDIYLCDWSKYRAIDKGAMQSAVSIHVRFVYDETALRFVYRFDGQPELGSAITPYSGSSNTLSHFVTLDARP